MKYLFTQLKELPDSPIGTVIRCDGIVAREFDEKPMYRMISKEGYYYNVPVGESEYDNPEWYKKEIDYERLTDLKCPYCGGTQGTFIMDTYYNNSYPEWDDVYPNCDHHGVNYDVAFECTCGHTRRLIRYGADREYVTNQCKLVEKVNNIVTDNKGEINNE